MENQKTAKAELEWHKIGITENDATVVVSNNNPEMNRYVDTTLIANDDINKGKDLKILNIMERSSILKDNRQLGFNLYYTEKPPEFLCENCGTILASKQWIR